MMVLSAGMQKAGTAWYFNLTNDMLVAAGHVDTRELRAKFHLERFMTAANCNIGNLSPQKLAVAILPALLGKTYVVKTHEGPTDWSRAMLKSGLMKASYIYRDPRDVVVSIYEHGERLRRAQAKSATGFDRLETYPAAIEFVKQRLKLWRAWVNEPGVLIVRYEQLKENPLRECMRLCTHLGLALVPYELEGIIARYSLERASAGRAPHPLHFYKGTSGRWREALPPAHRQMCRSQFGPYLKDMGYPA